MNLNRRIAQIDLIIGRLVKWRGELLPRRFAPWHRISVWSIGLGVGLFASPFWVPAATQIADAVAGWVISLLGHVPTRNAPNVPIAKQVVGCDCSSVRWYHVPATYGGILIFFGILNYVFFAVILKLDFFVGGFLSTAVQPADTLESFANRLADRRGKEVRWSHVTEAQKATELTAGEVEGNDLGRLLHDALELTDKENLANLYSIELRGALEIGGRY
ncbi:hypothetical protein [Pseudooceanicola endophyticus]|uniref:hypothetical protein n=1 Tax=Pseudooceanicola endophyticus TaxID=2841273 RepID=UPI001C00B1A3|nr:hypothetical protein [Pseudooceanicola endophyticus]